MSDLFSRRGRAMMDRQVIEQNPELAALAFQGTVVLETNHSWASVEYLLLHPSFDVCEEGALPPTYDTIVNKQDDGQTTVEWRKAGAPK